ncbi:hypothetical protein Tco_0504179, partial [Tanacetum coccineum]
MNHSHVHGMEVADVTKDDKVYLVDDTPLKLRKISISPIVSVHEFEIEQYTLDRTIMKTQTLRDGIIVDTNRTPMYADIVNPMSSPRPNVMLITPPL